MIVAAFRTCINVKTALCHLYMKYRYLLTLVRVVPFFFLQGTQCQQVFAWEFCRGWPALYGLVTSGSPSIPFCMAGMANGFNFRLQAKMHIGTGSQQN